MIEIVVVVSAIVSIVAGVLTIIEKLKNI